MKIAVITGASSGIGREFARTLQTHGQYDELWAIARNQDRLDALAKELPVKVRTLSMDLSDEAFIPRLRELLQTEKPEIRLLINASGFGRFERTDAIALEDNLGMVDLNCRALTAVTMLCLPYMSAGAEILEVASVAAFQPIPCINVYAATKAYVLSFTRALAREVKGRGIRVMALCPFWTKTAFFDRAIHTDKEPVIKKYAAMYDPQYIVSYAWKKLSGSKRDYCIPGMTAKLQAAAVKLLPHKWIMSIWQRQQGMKF